MSPELHILIGNALAWLGLALGLLGVCGGLVLVVRDFLPSLRCRRHGSYGGLVRSHGSRRGGRG